MSQASATSSAAEVSDAEPAPDAASNDTAIGNLALPPVATRSAGLTDTSSRLLKFLHSSKESAKRLTGDEQVALAAAVSTPSSTTSVTKALPILNETDVTSLLNQFSDHLDLNKRIPWHEEHYDAEDVVIESVDASPASLAHRIEGSTKQADFLPPIGEIHDEFSSLLLNITSRFSSNRAIYCVH